MNRYENDDPETRLDRAVSDIREEPIDPLIIEDAAGRVRARLAADFASDAERRGVDARSGSSDTAVGESAAGAVGTRERGASILGCAGFQRLAPAYLAGSLSHPRALLLEDHVRDCVACRHAVEAARVDHAPTLVGTGKSTPDSRSHAGRSHAGRSHAPEPFAARAAARRSAARWTLAAAASIGIVLVALGTWQRFRPVSGQAQVHSLRGALYRVPSAGTIPVASIGEGATVPYGDEIRTAKGSGAVIQLADGSLIEMDERSAIRIGENRRDTTIRLPRGNIIVQAAKRSSGHLYVASDDALVSVTGTIFSVSHGTKGSRVSVIEGEVHVDHGGAKDVLRPGDQVSTHASLGKVSVADDIAWSHDVDRYITLLREMATVRRDLNQTVLTPDLRHSTRLLDSMPAGTVIYAALPNVGRTLEEMNRRIQEHVDQSEVLRQWWQENGRGRGSEPEVQQILEKIRMLGDQLGDEIVLSVQADGQGALGGIVLMSELKRPEEFKSILGDEVRKANAAGGGGPAFKVLPGALEEAGPGTSGTGGVGRAAGTGGLSRSGGAARGHGSESFSEMYLWIHEGRLVAATSIPLVRQIGSIMDGREANPFLESPFHARIAESYREGAGWLFCADVQALMDTVAKRPGGVDGRVRLVGPFHGTAALEKTGLLDVQHFILDVKESANRTDTHAVLTFDKPRTGLTSWLAPPAPMGALGFMTPDTTLLAAFVVKEPVRLVEELFDILETAHPGFGQRLTEFEAESGLKIREDVAAPLGGEFALAVDGPILPMPSWKLVFEVYDPERLQRTIELMVARIAAEARNAGHAGPTLETEAWNGGTAYVLRLQDLSIEIHYVFVDGYLVAAPSRTLIERAIQAHESGYALGGSQTFRALLPDDGQINFSALVYQNFGPMLGPIAKNLAGSKGLTPEQEQAVAALGAEAQAKLGCAYAEENRIVFASSGTGTLTANLGGLFGLDGGERGMAQLFEQAMRQRGPASAVPEAPEATEAQGD